MMNVAREIFNLNTQFINFYFMPGLWTPDMNFTLEKGKQMQEETLKMVSKLQFPINIATCKTSQAIAAFHFFDHFHLFIRSSFQSFIRSSLFQILTEAPPLERLFIVRSELEC